MNIEHYTAALELANTRWIDCEKQLAAERESHEKELDVVEANWSAELAAAVEALRDVRGYLVEQSRRKSKRSFADQRAGSDAEDLLPVIDAALVKIGVSKSIKK